MILGIGLDLQAISTIAASIGRETFVNKVFTPREIALCQQQPRRLAERFAGKYAVKEAYMKAIGAGIRQGVWFSQIEVLNAESGAPYVVTSGRAEELTQALGVARVHVTLSHNGNMAVGLTILEG